VVTGERTDCELTFSRRTANFTPVSDKYHVVQLANGAFSLRSERYGETFHPVVGPVAEAQALYVDQLALVDRVRSSRGEFVVWDVGLGAAANPLTFLDAVREVTGAVRIVSFDYTTEPLRVALQNQNTLNYLQGWERELEMLIANGSHRFKTGDCAVSWELHLGDFPGFLKSPAAEAIPKPSAIFYDAFSPATNPAMWTLEVFTDLFRLLDLQKPCVMPTYSRSTMLRVTLLLAGFYVGRGHATGEKEETTIAANTLQHIVEPLDRSWLMRCKRSRSAEPLREGAYRQAPLSDATWEQLRSHPQFQ
jgi:tRNA U34 5-methylaminomethyl-2-thiouridine-forming methyltransferase MnmC